MVSYRCLYKLLKTFNKISKFILVFTTVITGWTSFVLLSNTTSNLEIKEVIKKMYQNQRNFIFNVKDLSLLLVKDANERFSYRDQDTTNFDNIENDF